MPTQVPLLPGAPCEAEQVAAWKVFREWHIPFLCAFTDNDPVTGDGDALFRELIPGAEGQPHQRIEGAATSSRKGAARSSPKSSLTSFAEARVENVFGYATTTAR